MSRNGSLEKLRAALTEQCPTFGGWLQLPSPDVAEIVASGFDWVVADLEHGGFDRRALVEVVRAIEGKDKVPLARLMTDDPLMGRQALDAGCSGLIVPHVSDADAFEGFVDVCTWPPGGSRSIGFFRANGYGQHFAEYAVQAAKPIFVPMIESRAGLDNLESILSTGKADAVLIGPYDLSASLGAAGDFASAPYREAEDKVLATCLSFGVSAGIHDVTPTSTSIATNVARGYRFVACGMDSTFLTQAVATINSFGDVANANRT